MRRLPDVIRYKEAITLIRCNADPRKKLLFGLGFFQGMRISEIAGLQAGDIDLDAGMIHIKHARTQNGMPKKDVTRQIPVAPEMVEGLKMYKDDYLPFKESIRTLQFWFEQESVLIFGKRMHVHNLRHSSATHYLQVKHWPIQHVQDFLGHANLTCTQVYIRTDPQQMKAYMNG